MTELLNAGISAAWLCMTLLLTFERSRTYRRKGEGRDAVQGQAGGLAVPPAASQRR